MVFFQRQVNAILLAQLEEIVFLVNYIVMTHILEKIVNFSNARQAFAFTIMNIYFLHLFVFFVQIMEFVKVVNAFVKLMN